MAANAAQLVHHLRRLADSSVMGAAADAVLLERYIQRRDEDAFAILVARYGPMVLRLCRRVLPDAHAAEDCLQATFLVLARNAASVRRRDSLATFLYGVAYRVAHKARLARLRRQREKPLLADQAPADPHPSPLDELTGRELLTVLDQEVQRLPQRYRLPVILCCLEGRTREEAASQLGWSAGSLKGRLERGRATLHARLARRGLSLSAALAAVEVSRGVASAGTPALAAAMVRAAAFAAGPTWAAAPAHVVALAKGAFPAGMTRLVSAAVLLLTVGVFAAGTGLLVRQTPGAGPVGALGPSAGAGKPNAQGPKQAQGEPLPAGAVARMGSVRFCSGTTVHSVAFSPDRKTLASGNAHGTVSVWEVATGKEIRVLQGRQGAVVSAAFSSDGKLLAARCMDGDIFLWETSTWKQARRIDAPPATFPPSHTGSTAWAFRIAFSPDGKSLAAAAGDLTGRDNEIRLWDVGTGKECRRFRGHQGAVRSFAFAPDGKTLASAGDDKTVRLWSPDTGKQLLLLQHRGKVASLAYSPDGKTLASGEDDRLIHFWSVAAGNELRQTKASGLVKSIVFIDEQTLAWGDEKGEIHLVDGKSGKELRRMVRHEYGVSDLCRSPDGKTLASVGDGQDHAVHLWQIDTGKKLSPPPDAHQGRVESVAFSPDGKTLVSAGGDATVRFWDPLTGKERRRSGGKFGHMTHAVAFSPDGKTLVVAADGGQTLQFLEPTSGKELRLIKNPASGWFTSVAFSPDGKTLLAGGNRFDGQWRGFFLWDATTGKELRQFRGHTDNVKSVAFSPDGKMAASGGEDRTVRLWETATGKPLRRLTGHRHWVETVAFSADGETLVSADARSICFWSPATGKELRRLECEAGVSTVAFGPDGKTLASGEYDPALRGSVVCLREVATGKEIRRWAGHRNGVSSLAFSPDGRALASGAWDTVILVWDVTGLGKTDRRPATPLVRKELEELWGHLAGADVPRAYRAVWRLGSAPGQAVAFLRDRLPPVPAADARRIARLVSDLDSEQFAVREAATTDLEKLGTAAELSLRKVFASRPSLEVHDRVKRLLQKLEGAAQSAERLRTSRALQALEHMGDPEARRVLARLAGGAAEVWQTREAKAALQRVDRRKAASRQ
jgi:RNA polymerase sigma factor (sigma-70 family)